jgi:LuxR family maltose regulon positive regulatory protein
MADPTKNRHVKHAKISRPKLAPGRIYPRVRLFRALDKACDQYPMVWVSGPPGAGKTTLIASYFDHHPEHKHLWYQIDEGDNDIAGFFYYLGEAVKKSAGEADDCLPRYTPEYSHGIPAFTRRYFEKICDCLQHPYALVLDNFERVAEDSACHEVIAHAVDALPAGCHLVIISRRPAPPACARLHANRVLATIDWRELRLTEEETRDITRLLHPEADDADLVRNLLVQTKGWMAGTVLLLHGLGGGSRGKVSPPGEAPQILLDYFAKEVVEQQNEDMQRFLLVSALLPFMTPEMAQKLTGNKASGEILKFLYRSHYFTERHGSQSARHYVYHPLFREYLLTKLAQTCSPEELGRLQRRCGAILENAGQFEAAEELYLAARDWNSLERVVQRHAPDLLRQGRAKTLESWIARFPGEVVTQNPWLLYWLGAARQCFDASEARLAYERAFFGFQERGDVTGIFLSWSGVADTICFGFSDFNAFDPWVSLMDDLIRDHPEFPSREVECRVTMSMLSALLWRQPAHPGIQLWATRAMNVFYYCPDFAIQIQTGFLLVHYHFWVSGDFTRMKLVTEVLQRRLDSLSHQDFHKLLIKSASWRYYNATGQSDTAMRTVEEWSEIARSSGMHVLDRMMFASGASVCICAGNLSRAAEYLDRLWLALGTQGRSMPEGLFYSLRAYLASEEGRYDTALQDAELGHMIFTEIGVRVLVPFSLGVIINIHIERGDLGKAASALARLGSITADLANPLYTYMHDCFAARLRFAEDDREGGLAALQNALRVAGEGGYSNFMSFSRKAMASLCALALDAGIEVDYAKSLIRACRLVPVPGMEAVADWPWPVQIRTLGGFSIAVDGKDVEFAVKTQKRPLELLKALITLGGTDVDMGHLIEILWPDAEGDAAHQSLKSTLHRLRRILGDSQALLVGDGRLSLNRNLVWTDRWAFEQALSRARSEPEAADARKERIQRAVALYRGPYLGTGSQESWALTQREHLRRLHQQAVLDLGRYDESNGDFEQAIRTYEYALALDDMAEALYQRLIACHQQLGQKSEALTAYQRCRHMLATRFGVNPSHETEHLCEMLKLDEPDRQKSTGRHPATDR